MQLQELVSAKLLGEVPPDWWRTEDGQGFLRRQEQKLGWIKFLGGLDFNAWFTMTFEKPAVYSMLAIDRAKRVLKRACKGVGLECNAFIASEQHLSGTYHVHGMLRVGAIGREFEEMFLRHCWKVAFEAYGRNSFSSIGDNEAVLHYVSKYLVKRPSDWMLVGCKKS